MSLRKKTAVGLLWSVGQTSGSRIITLLVFTVLARLLEPEAIGLVALAGVYISFLLVFSERNFGTAIEQREVLERGHLDTTFWVFLATSLFFVLVTVLFSDLIARLFKEPTLSPILRWLSLSYLFMALSGVQSAIMRRKLRMKALAIRAIVGQIAGGIVGIAMALKGMGVWSLVGMQLTNGAVSTAVLWTASNWRPGFDVKPRYFRDLSSFGFSMMGSRVLDFFSRRSDALLIGYFLGPAALGLYNVAYRILLVLSQVLTTSAAGVALPAFSKIQNDPPKMCTVFYQAVRLTSFVAFPVFAGLAVLAPEVIRVVFGDQWTQSIPVMRVLAFIGILHTVTWFHGVVIIAMGRATAKLVLLSIHTVANVIAFMIAVKWGIVAVAAAYVIRGYLFAPMDMLYMKRLIPVSFRTYAKELAPNILATAIMSAAVVVYRAVLPPATDDLIVLTTGVLVGIVSYGLASFLVSRRTIEDVIQLIKLTRNNGPLDEDAPEGRTGVVADRGDGS